MAIRVAINGLGRIGGLILRALIERELFGNQIEVVAVVDLDNNAKNKAHGIKYDSTHGILKAEISTKKSKPESEYDDVMVINGHDILCLKAPKEKKIETLPWGDLGIDFVIESSGIFSVKKELEGHLAAGAKKVVLTVPPKEGEDIPLFVMGLNQKNYQPDIHHIVSNSSCTTNCLGPIALVIHQNFKIKHGLMTTIHSYTNDQRTLDQAHKDLRRARAAALNMIPTTTGAARAIGLVLPELKGKLDGLSVRVPTPNVSIVDLVAEVEKPTSKSEVNEVLKTAANGLLKGILGFIEEPLVSSDFNGYSNRVIDLIIHMVMTVDD